VQATQAKNRFGEILKSAQTAPVIIEKHGQPQAVVMSFAAYTALVHERRAPEQRQLDSLREEFDQLYVRMQTASSRSVVDKLLDAPASELNLAATRSRTKSRG
jgi:prevent-host-death family protein